MIMFLSRYCPSANNFKRFHEYKNERAFIEAYKMQMLTFIRKDKNLFCDKFVPKKYFEATNIFKFCGDTEISFDAWYGYCDRQVHTDVTNMFSQIIHWNWIMMHLPDDSNYNEEGCTKYGINRGASYRIICLLFGLLDNEDKVLCETSEQRLWYIYIMIQFELFSREKLLFLFHKSADWSSVSTAKIEFVKLAQYQIAKESINKCKEHIKKYTKENSNKMLDANKDVTDIVLAFKKEFKEDFLIHLDDKSILHYIAYPNVMYY